MTSPGVGGATPERVEALKRLLVRTFGPDVNLGNVPPEQIVATELVRLGLEDAASWPSA